MGVFGSARSTPAAQADQAWDYNAWVESISRESEDANLRQDAEIRQRQTLIRDQEQYEATSMEQAELLGLFEPRPLFELAAEGLINLSDPATFALLSDADPHYEIGEDGKWTLSEFGEYKYRNLVNRARIARGEDPLDDRKWWQKGLGKVMDLPLILPGSTIVDNSQTPKVSDALNALSWALDPLGQTVGELIEGDQPTLTKSLNVAENWAEAKEKFEERPLWQQFTLGIVDPLLIFGAGKSALKGARYLAKTAPDATRRALNSEVRRAHAEAQIRQAQNKALSLAREGVFTRPMPTTAEVLDKLRPSPFLSRIHAVRKLVNAADPNAQILDLKPGSTERVGREANYYRAEATVMARGRVSHTMAYVDSLGIEEAFGAVPESTANNRWFRRLQEGHKKYLKRIGYDGDPVGLYAYGVTKAASGKKLDYVPFIGDVLSNPDKFQLTTHQRRIADSLGNLNEQHRQMLLDEGIEVVDVRKKFDLMYYIARFPIDERARWDFEIVDIRNGKTVDNLEDPRLYQEMRENILERGTAYHPIRDSQLVYFRNTYNKIINKRMETHLEPLATAIEPDPFYTFAVEKAVKNEDRLKKARSILQGVKEGMIPRRGPWQTVANALPELKPQIDTLRKLTPQRLARISEKLTDQLPPHVTPEDFWDEMRRHIDTEEIVPDEFPVTSIEDFHANVAQITPTYKRVAAQSFIRAVEPTFFGPKRVKKGPDVAKLEDSESFTNAKNVAKEALRKGELSFGELNKLELDFYSALHSGLKRRHPSRTIAHALDTETGQISAINATLRALNVTGKEARKARTAIERAVRETQEQQVRVLADALLNQIDDKMELARFRTADTTTTLKKHELALKESVKHMKVPATGTDLSFDNAVAVKLKKILDRDGNPVVGAAGTVASGIRVLQTGVDLGWIAIQHLFLATSNPEQWARMVRDGVTALVAPGVMSRRMIEHAESFVAFIDAGGILRSSDVMRGMEDLGLLAKYVKKAQHSIPFDEARIATQIGTHTIGTAINRFGNAFEVGIDIGKIYWWEALTSMGTRSPDQLREIARFINKVTGTLPGDALGTARTQQQLESALFFFAPGYTRATTSLMLDAMRGGMRGGLARDAFAKLVAGTLMIYVSVSHALGQTPNLNPTDAGFMSWKVWGAYLGPGHKFRTYLSAIANTLQDWGEDPTAIVSRDWWTEWNNPIWRTMRGQAPATSNLFLSATRIGEGGHHEDYLGRVVPGLESPWDYIKFVGKTVSPFWANDMIESMGSERERIYGYDNSRVTGPASFFGARSFNIPLSADLKELKDVVFEREHGMTYDEYEERYPIHAPVEYRKLRQKYPRLRELHEAAHNERRESAEYRAMEEYQEQRASLREEFYRKINAAARKYDEALDPSAAAQEMHYTIRSETKYLAGALAQLDSSNPGVLAQFKEFEESRDELLPIEAALDLFMISLGTFIEDPDTGKASELGVLEEDGTVNRGRVAELRRHINEVFPEYEGKLMMDALSDTLLEGKLNPIDYSGREIVLEDTVKEFFSAPALLQGYWTAYERVIPEELWSAYEDYDQQDELEQKARTRSGDRHLARFDVKVTRERIKMRREDAELDALLYRLGYGRPMNSENRHLIQELREEFRERTLTPSP